MVMVLSIANAVYWPSIDFLFVVWLVCLGLWAVELWEYVVRMVVVKGWHCLSINGSAVDIHRYTRMRT